MSQKQAEELKAMVMKLLDESILQVHEAEEFIQRIQDIADGN